MWRKWAGLEKKREATFRDHPFILRNNCQSIGIDMSRYRLTVAFLLLEAVAAFGLRLSTRLSARATNFQDADVECSSEGGKWNVPGSSVISKSNLVSSDLTAADFPAIELWSDSFKLMIKCSFAKASALEVTSLVDQLEQRNPRHFRAKLILRFFIRQKLAELLRDDAASYAATAQFLSPSRLPRELLPNVQFLVPFNPNRAKKSAAAAAAPADMTPDCSLPAVEFQDSPLDNILLGVFRGIVQDETKFKSPQKGIKGLLEEGKTYMLSVEGAVVENQHAFVKRTLGRLMTPFLPPFYRLFMAGIVPSAERGDPDWLVSLFASINSSLPGKPLVPGKQIGPWFYAPALTSWVTPPLLQFLVGPSRANFRKDGELGGLIVEKCKFLQESGCKGLCLHQCKIPAQDFFAETLGLSLSVEPNFATQECQWSWGVEALPHEADPAWPQGCLAGCPTRQEINLKASL